MNFQDGAFFDSGPRPTPAIKEGRVFVHNTDGYLACLGLNNGKKRWSHDVLSATRAKLPDWGLSSSPLVTHGIVVVFCGPGEAKKGLRGYRAESGEFAWAVDTGLTSYSSPHPATIGGREQVLFVDDEGLSSVDPSTGELLWKYVSRGNPPRSLQPAQVSETQLLVPLGMEMPTDLVDVTVSGDKVAATKRWRWSVSLARIRC